MAVNAGGPSTGSRNVVSKEDDDEDFMDYAQKQRGEERERKESY